MKLDFQMYLFIALTIFNHSFNHTYGRYFSCNVMTFNNSQLCRSNRLIFHTLIHLSVTSNCSSIQCSIRVFHISKHRRSFRKPCPPATNKGGVCGRGKGGLVLLCRHDCGSVFSPKNPSNGKIIIIDDFINHMTSNVLLYFSGILRRWWPEWRGRV